MNVRCVKKRTALTKKYWKFLHTGYRNFLLNHLSCFFGISSCFSSSGRIRVDEELNKQKQIRTQYNTSKSRSKGSSIAIVFTSNFGEVDTCTRSTVELIIITVVRTEKTSNYLHNVPKYNNSICRGHTRIGRFAERSSTSSTKYLHPRQTSHNNST